MRQHHCFIVLTLVTERWMEDEGQKRLRELDLNIHLYFTLNYVTSSEHLKYSARNCMVF